VEKLKIDIKGILCNVCGSDDVMIYALSSALLMPLDSK